MLALLFLALALLAAAAYALGYRDGHAAGGLAATLRITAAVRARMARARLAEAAEEGGRP